MRHRYLLLFLFFSLFISAQRITSFDVYNTTGTVSIRFTISAGYPSDGYSVLHSIDSISFTSVHDENIPFGDYSKSTDRSFTHLGAQQDAVNYYKIQLQPYEQSQIRRIYVSKKPLTGLLAYPNPVWQNTETMHLRFTNLTTDTRVIGFLYNQNGNPLRTYDFVTKIDLSTIPVGDLPNGLYVLWLTDGTQAFTSKFIVFR